MGEESDQPLWKELYTQALMESDRQKVTLLLLAAELAVIERSRQLLNSPEQHEERTELAVAKAALETIRFRKLVGLRLQQADFPLVQG
jgi:hypothetical protein